MRKAFNLLDNLHLNRRQFTQQFALVAVRNGGLVSACRERGCEFLDARVSGSLIQAEGRELVFMVGREEAAFTQGEPVMKAMGRASLGRRAPGRRSSSSTTCFRAR